MLEGLHWIYACMGCVYVELWTIGGELSSTFDLVMFTVSLGKSALVADHDFSFFSIAAQSMQHLLSVALGVVNHHNGHGHTDTRIFLVLDGHKCRVKTQTLCCMWIL